MQKQCRSFLEETAARNLFPADHTSVREQTRKSSFRPLLGGGLFLVQGGANRDSGVGIGGAAVNAHAKNFRVRRVDLSRGDSSLDRLKLFRSTTGKGQDVNGKKDIFLAAEVAELYGCTLIADQSEVWSGITDLQ